MSVCSMVKKSVLGGVLGVAALGLIFGTNAPSYLRSAVTTARNNIKNSVPVEFEINRLRQDIENLDQGMKGQLQFVAREEQEIKNLKQDLASNKAKLADEEKTILTLRKMISDDNLKLAGNANPSYTEKDVRGDLIQKFENYQRLEKIVAQQERTLRSREELVVKALDQLQNLKTKKKELVSKIDAIEAQIKANAAAEAPGYVPVDKSALSAIEKSINELEKRVEIETRERDLATQYLSAPSNEASVDDRDIVREIDGKFNTGAAASGDKNL